MNMLNPKIKMTASTSIVNFVNISNSYYDMIISIQNYTVNQTITMKDTEGNDITEQPVILTTSIKIILKDIKIGSILFSDPNTYSIIISYVTKRESTGIPYIDFDFSTGNQNISSTRKIYDFTEIGTGNFNSTTFSCDFIPVGYIAHVLGIFFTWTAGTTNSTTLIGIDSGVNALGQYYPLGYVSMDITSGDQYSCAIGESVVTQSSLPGVPALSQLPVNNATTGMLNIEHLDLINTGTLIIFNSIESPAIASSDVPLTIRYILEPITNGV